jgi:glycosyltransferase involved in cell wall biosynthesis
LDAIISIVIPAYNAESFLRSTLESVIHQTFADWKLCVVNDGSTDSTAEVIREFERQDSRVFSLSQANSGVSTARNNGARAMKSGTPYIIFLDHDDIWEPTMLEVLVAEIQLYPECVCAYGLSKFIDIEGKDTMPGYCETSCRLRPTFDGKDVKSLPLDQPSTFETFIVSCVTPTPSAVLMRREVFDRVGGFDPTDAHCQDWDIYIRMSRHGSFRFVDKVLIGYRCHDGNVSRDKQAQRRQIAQVLRKAISSPDNSWSQRTIAIKSFRAAQRFYMRDKLKYFKHALLKGDLTDAFVQIRPALGSVAKLLVGRP